MVDVKYYADGENGLLLKLDLEELRKSMNLPPFKGLKDTAAAEKKEEPTPRQRKVRKGKKWYLCSTNKEFPPPFSTRHTLDEHGHRLIGASRLFLLVLRFVRPAATTLEAATEMVHHVCFHPIRLRRFKHLFLYHVALSIMHEPHAHLFLHFIAHHLICAHSHQSSRLHIPIDNEPQQTLVVPQIESDVAKPLSVLGSDFISFIVCLVQFPFDLSDRFHQRRNLDERVIQTGTE